MDEFDPKPRKKTKKEESMDNLESDAIHSLGIQQETSVPTAKSAVYLKALRMPQHICIPSSAHIEGLAPGFYYHTDGNYYAVGTDMTQTLYLYGSAERGVAAAKVNTEELIEKAFAEGKLAGYKEANQPEIHNVMASQAEQKFTMQDMLKTIAVVINPQPLATAVAKNELNKGVE